MSSSLKVIFTSWNCQGSTKQVMNRLKFLQSKTAFLQETHLVGKDTIKVRRRWHGQVIAAPYTSHARGVMMAGDFNCTLDPSWDRYSSLDETHVRSRKAKHHFIRELNLLDIWKDFKPKTTEYSSYSSTYQTLVLIIFQYQQH